MLLAQTLCFFNALWLLVEICHFVLLQLLIADCTGLFIAVRTEPLPHAVPERSSQPGVTSNWDPEPCISLTLDFNHKPDMPKRLQTALYPQELQG